MIARTWTGRTKKEHADAYAQVLHETGLNVMGRTPGNRGAYLLRRIDRQEAEFLLISLWESIEVVKAFAGQDAEKARYFPEDDKYLLTRAEHVTHFEVIHAAALP